MHGDSRRRPKSQSSAASGRVSKPGSVAVVRFDQCGFNDGPFDNAETLCKAKNTARVRASKMRLLRVDELPASWAPMVDPCLTVWESVHHFIRALSEGEDAAATLVAWLDADRGRPRTGLPTLQHLQTRELSRKHRGIMLWPSVDQTLHDLLKQPGELNRTCFSKGRTAWH